MTFRVRSVEATPNPNAIKFVFDRPVSSQSTSFFNAEAAAGHPLAIALFSIPGVKSLLFLDDFITINKSPDARWPEITRRARKVFAGA